MNAQEDGRQGHWSGPTALAGPENLAEPQAAAVKDTPSLPKTSEVGSSHRRWRRRPRPMAVLTDVAAWALFVILIAAILISLCALLTLAWPS